VTPFIPRRFEGVAFAVLVTFIMTCMIAGISTALALGITDPAFLPTWFGAWMTSWAFAAPIMTVVAPFVRRTVARHVRTS
jgi:hypothetical protein